MNIHNMNNIGDLEISLLGFLSEKPMHGYDLHRKVVDLRGFGIVWRLKIGILYSMLSKLHDAELVSVQNYQDGNRPVRKEFSISREGKTLFEEWVLKPVIHGRDFRTFFLLKFFFALQKGHEEALTLISIQKMECSNWISNIKDQLITKTPQSETNFHVYVNQYRINQIEANMDWLNWAEKSIREEK